MSAPLYTPGPWHWNVNTKTRQVMLETSHSGRIFVMGFARSGMQRAQPLFQVRDARGDGRMVALFEEPERLGTKPDHNGAVRLTHPDACLIEAAPVLYAALAECAKQLRATGDRGHAAVAEAALATARGELVIPSGRGASQP